jgi:hypothetical protein
LAATILSRFRPIDRYGPTNVPSVRRDDRLRRCAGSLSHLAGSEIGALTYNTVHTYVLPAVLGGAGLYAEVPIAVLVASVWVAHIGADRAAGYGLKYSSDFKDTHLSTQPALVSAFVDEG